MELLTWMISLIAFCTLGCDAYHGIVGAPGLNQLESGIESLGTTREWSYLLFFSVHWDVMHIMASSA